MDKLGVITRKGQVTIPVELRNALGLRQGDRVAFRLEDKEVRIIPRGSVTERTAGMFRTTRAPLTVEELREAIEVAIAEEAVERSES